MNFRKYLPAAALLVSAILALAWAGDPTETTRSKPETPDTRRAADLLFQDIMQTLPSAAKAQVDSAGKARHTAVAGQSRTIDSAPPAEISTKQPVSDALKELPDQLRSQVEKAIADMEQRKEQRAIEFREHRRALQESQQK